MIPPTDDGPRFDGCDRCDVFRTGVTERALRVNCFVCEKEFVRDDYGPWRVGRSLRSPSTETPDNK